MALGNKTVKELPSISSGTPSGLQNTDLFYSQRPGVVDNDYRVSGSDLAVYMAAQGFVPNTMTVNGYTLASPINLTYADVGAVANTTTVNGHALAGAVVISKSDVGLGNVLNTSTANTLAGYDNSGAFGGVTLAGGLSLVAGVLSAPSGTVTAVSIVTAHGFAGSSGGGATPALTINCTITGLLKGDGTSISAAAAGTDYVAPSTTVNGHALSSNITLSTTDVVTAGSITNAMLGGSIAASKLVGTDIVTVGTLTGGATGAGFTIALSTSTVTGTLPGARLPAFAGGQVTSSAGSLILTIGAGTVTNAMLAGSIAASNLVGSDIATVGTITAGTWQGTPIGAQYGGLLSQAAGGTADALTATYTPALTLADQEICVVIPGSSNATTTPTFAPNGLTAHTITKNGGAALAANDLVALKPAILQYNLAHTRWELLNPAVSSSSSGTAPTYQILTSGTTYTTPANVKWIEVTMVGGGAGGGATNTNAGGNGGASSFNGITAAGGTGGGFGAAGNSGAGGTGGTGTTGVIWRRPGGDGDHGSAASNGYGGRGGSNSFYRGAVGNISGAGGVTPPANQGVGGGGAGNAAANLGGGGGGAGEEVFMIISTPSPTYTYAIGTRGLGGAAGTSAGFNGSTGFIVVKENY